MNLKEALRKYFDEEIKKDTALAEKYDSQKIDECESYVNGEAKKYLHSQSGAIEDCIVYKWARDFYLDSKIFESGEKQKEVQKETKSENKNNSMKVSKKKKDESEFENFFDFGE